jgi:hypothetical protein
MTFAWLGQEGRFTLVIVNYGEFRAQCYVDYHPIMRFLKGNKYILQDIVSSVKYERECWGLFLDEAEWSFHIFDAIPQEED